MANLISHSGSLSLTAPGVLVGTVGKSWALTPIFQAGNGYTQNAVQVITSTAVAVVGASNTNPITITTSGLYFWQTGDVVSLTAIGGNGAANGTYPITTTGPTTFTIPVAGTNPYTSGGLATLLAVPLPLESVTQAGAATFSNLDATNYLQMFVQNTFNCVGAPLNAYLPFARIPAAASQLVWLEPTSTYYVIANTAPCYLEWLVLNS